MAGAAVTLKWYDREYRRIQKALSRMAEPDLEVFAEFAGEELLAVTEEAFETESDPVSGEKWEPHSSATLKRGKIHSILVV